MQNKTVFAALDTSGRVIKTFSSPVSDRGGPFHGEHPNHLWGLAQTDPFAYATGITSTKLTPSSAKASPAKVDPLLRNAGGRARAGRALVVGNLPYQITHPLLFAITDAAGQWPGDRPSHPHGAEGSSPSACWPGPGSQGVRPAVGDGAAAGRGRDPVSRPVPGRVPPAPPRSTSTVLRLRPRPTPLGTGADPGASSLGWLKAGVCGADGKDAWGIGIVWVCRWM